MNILTAIGVFVAVTLVALYLLYRRILAMNVISDDKYPLNPKRLENLTVVGRNASEISVDDLPVVVEEMRRVFQSNLTRPLDKRRLELQKLQTMIQENTPAIAKALMDDLHKSPRGAYGEPMLAAKSVRQMLKNLEAYNAPESGGFSFLLPTTTSMVVPEPYGTVLLHGIWNFPFELVLTPLAGAIAGGNNVIIKPCNFVPTCSKLMADLIHQYMDSRVVQVVGGPGIPDDRLCSDKLLDNRFDKIMFTGSSNGGRFIMQKASRFLTPVLLELGGKNPSFIDESADLTLTAKELWSGRQQNCGQICISADLVFVVRSRLDALIEQLKVFKESQMNNWEESGGRLVVPAQFERVRNMLKETKGKILMGGESNEQTRHFEPAVVLLDGIPSRNEERDVGLVQETFGPILWIVPVDTIQDAVEYVRDQPKPLALYIFSYTQSTIDYIIGNTASGNVMVNGTMSHYIHDGVPFGGVGESGMGSYHGKQTFNEFVHMKGVVQKWKFNLPPSIQTKLFNYGIAQ